MVSKKILIFILLGITVFILAWLIIPDFYSTKPVFGQYACSPDESQWTKFSGNVYLDQNRSGSSAGDSCTGTASKTNNVGVKVQYACGFADQTVNPNNCAWSNTNVFKITGSDAGYVWSCVPPSGWLCGNTVSSTWNGGPWIIDFWARPNVTCSISGPTQVCPGTQVSYTLSCSGASPQGFYRCPGCSWQPLPNPVSLAPGSYDMAVNSSLVGGAACSGNPDCTFNGGSTACNGWIDCGGSDRLSVTASSSYCPSPTRTPTRTPTTIPPTATRTRTPTPVTFSQVLSNASFETDTIEPIGLPDGWDRNRSTDVRVSYPKAPEGSYVFRIGKSGSSDSYYHIRQNKANSGNSGDKWQFKVWSLVENPSASGKIRVTLRFKKSDGTYSTTRTYLTKSSTGSYQTGSISAPVNYQSVEIKLENSITSGYVYFDDVRLGL